jgi:hypothetical protein
VLGIVILFFALGMRKGLLGLVVDLWAKRVATPQRDIGDKAAAGRD